MTPEQLLKHAAQTAKHLFDHQGQVLPMLLLENERGQLVPCVFPMPEQRSEREELAKGLRRFFREARIVQYAALLEAWKVECSGGVLPESFMHGASLASHPDRREVIDVVVESKDQQLGGTYYILRPEHGKATLSEFKVRAPDVLISGTFSNLLGEQPDD
jgi:hypothetical protein